jgi:ribosomal subunit interface protein
MGETGVDVVVKGRNVEVPGHYREHVTDKLDKAVRLDRKIVEIDVELLHERNPRQQDHCQRVEITCYSRGPVVRAEATARDFYSALDEAIGKLTGRLRRAADRRRMHRRRRPPASVAVESLPTPPVEQRPAEAEEDRPWRIRRAKEHSGDPITVDDALFRMELVGHDFFLFLDKESGRPSVVYRRKGYDYGVISLAGPAGSRG